MVRPEATVKFIPPEINLLTLFLYIQIELHYDLIMFHQGRIHKGFYFGPYQVASYLITSVPKNRSFFASAADKRGNFFHD